jgi:hypothetical protein
MCPKKGVSLEPDTGDLGRSAMTVRGRTTPNSEFDGLDPIEKAAVERALKRCRALAAQIESELRNKRREHFIDELLLADLCASLEEAANVLGEKGRRSAETTRPPMVKGSQTQRGHR